MFTNLCNIYILKSVGIVLMLQPAQAKKSKLALLSWTRSQARLGLKSKWDILAELDSGSEGSRISELGSAWDRM